MNIKDILYSLACLSFSVVIGAAVYEHLGVVPRWAAAPPASLAMFQGEYGLNAGAFWKIIHPITLFLLVSALIINWNSDRKRNLIITIGCYIVVLLITAVYFVPTLLEITGTPYSSMVDPVLTERAKMWEILSVVRLVFLICLALTMFLGLTKAGDKSK